MAHRAVSRVSWQTLSPLFWVLATVYGGHRILVWLVMPRPEWIQFYLDDLLCLPIILTITLFIMRYFQGPQFKLTPHQVGIAVVYYALAFEVVFPWFLPRYTTDVVDAFLYSLGGWFFYRFLNK